MELLSLIAIARRHHDLSSARQEGPSDECNSQAMHSLQEDYEVSTAVKGGGGTEIPRRVAVIDQSSQLPDYNATGVSFRMLSIIGIVTIRIIQKYQSTRKLTALVCLLCVMLVIFVR